MTHQTIGGVTQTVCTVFGIEDGSASCQITAHIDPDTGKGTHGIDMPEDMDVQHFYGLFRGKYVLGRDC